MGWYDDYIVKKAGVQGGSAIIRGTRTPIRTVSILYHVTYPGRLDELQAALPHLSHDQIEAALAYYEDHRAEVDADIERHRTAWEQVRQAS